MMEILGLTLDLVTCISLQLAVGLCVDYAAHIGHTFLMMTGDRNQRALETVSYIGSAVMYGGGSTMLSVSMLRFVTFIKLRLRSLNKSCLFTAFQMLIHTEHFTEFSQLL